MNKATLNCICAVIHFISAMNQNAAAHAMQHQPKTHNNYVFLWVAVAETGM